MRPVRSGTNCTIYHGVTLGGTGKDTGKRHPTLGNNVLIGAGTKVLGPVYIGDNSRIGAGSVVLRNLPANCTAVGVPAEVVRINNKAVNPADDLDQQDLPDIVAQRLTDLDRRLGALEKRCAGATPPPHSSADRRTTEVITIQNASACALGILQLEEDFYLIEQQRTACGLSAVAFSRKGSKRET